MVLKHYLKVNKQRNVKSVIIGIQQLQVCKGVFCCKWLHLLLCILLIYVIPIFETSAMCNVFIFIPHNIQMQCCRLKKILFSLSFCSEEEFLMLKQVIIDMLRLASGMNLKLNCAE